LWRGIPGFDGRAQLATWVYRVALNTALSDRRRLRPPHQALETVAERGDSGEPRDPIGVLEAFLATLEPVQRAVLLLDLEGLEREQIADVLGLSPNAVAVRMTRLRQAFEARFLEN
jgi:RNA polymerase sigma factor (sigma-70 family)